MVEVQREQHAVRDVAHYCRICGASKPNDQFSGKGHRTHVCKECAQIPKKNRDAIEHEAEIFGYLAQSHISQRNIGRLRKLAASDIPRIAELANIVLEVAVVKPHKKRRLKVIARERRDLLEALERTGLILAHGS